MVPRAFIFISVIAARYSYETAANSPITVDYKFCICRFFEDAKCGYFLSDKVCNGSGGKMAVIFESGAV